MIYTGYMKNLKEERMPKEKILRGWCNQEVASSDCKAKSLKNDHGNVIEMRCPKCNKVLAAYLKDEGNFFASIRNF